jgi:hypothetical protein
VGGETYLTTGHRTGQRKISAVTAVSVILEEQIAGTAFQNKTELHPIINRRTKVTLKFEKTTFCISIYM